MIKPPAATIAGKRNGARAIAALAPCKSPRLSGYLTGVPMIPTGALTVVTIRLSDLVAVA
jgi:hypothetical protein